ncbi:MAG TPA: hypothetical protein VGD81_06320 [Opitutaceae bacterium]
MGLRFLFTLALLVATALARAEWSIPPGEAADPPKPARLAALRSIAAADGWPVVEAAARDAALAAYARDRLEAADSWLLVARWARLFGEKQGGFVSRWIDALNAARLGHPNMRRRYDVPDAPLSACVSPQLGAWLLENRAFSRAFFDLVSPYDYMPAVLGVLDTLHAADVSLFSNYTSLALAIAVVYDVPPPPGWPHGQVDARLVPRRLPDPLTAFRFWTDADRQNRTLHRIARLEAGELKFVVDVSAPFPELVWAQQSLRLPLSQLAKAYDAVAYRTDRLQAGEMNWAENDYALPTILARGGICVDQAYFAAQAGKARGVPTLIFRGAGLDGRHAWFGFLDGQRRWQMDAGRYAEQRYVSGVAFDPQTWADISDHEISFLAEGFRLLPTFAQARIHALMAAELLELGRAADAVRAARKAVNYERRHLAAWQTLLAAQQPAGADLREREATLREAAAAFQRYPDLNVRFLNEAIGLLRARGETSAADNEERLLARKFQKRRSDLSVAQLAETLERAVATQPPAEQVRAYNRVVDQYGHGAGMEFFDRIVQPFVLRLAGQGRKTEARQALERARRVLRPEDGRQLDQELRALAASVK